MFCGPKQQQFIVVFPYLYVTYLFLMKFTCEITFLSTVHKKASTDLQIKRSMLFKNGNKTFKLKSKSLKRGAKLIIKCAREQNMRFISTSKIFKFPGVLGTVSPCLDSVSMSSRSFPNRNLLIAVL